MIREIEMAGIFALIAFGWSPQIPVFMLDGNNAYLLTPTQASYYIRGAAWKRTCLRKLNSRVVDATSSRNCVVIRSRAGSRIADVSNGGKRRRPLSQPKTLVRPGNSKNLSKPHHCK